MADVDVETPHTAPPKANSEDVGPLVPESTETAQTDTQGCLRGCCPSPREHYLSLSFVDHGQGSYHTKDRQLTKNRDAYKRLRQNGLQPKSVDGSAQVERSAKTEAQVEGRPDANI